MTKPERQKLAELSLIYGIPIIMQAKENSRLAGLQRKLQKQVMPDLMTLPTMGDEQAVFIDDRIEAWLKKIGWWYNETHISTLVSFCMDIIEESPFKYNPQIMDTLIKIAEHLDNGKEFKHPKMEDRDALLDTWKTVYA